VARPPELFFPNQSDAPFLAVFETRQTILSGGAAVSRDETVSKIGAARAGRQFSKGLKMGQMQRRRFGTRPAEIPFVVRIEGSKGVKLGPAR
jgi:hypothetical protein